MSHEVETWSTSSHVLMRCFTSLQHIPHYDIIMIRYDELGKLLANIAATSTGVTQDSETALHFLGELQVYLQEYREFSSAESLLQAIFDDNGLLSFLRKNISSKPFEKPREQALAIITELSRNTILHERKDLFLPYCLTIKDVLNTCWKSDREPARIQNAALECLGSLLKHYGTQLNSYEFEATDLYNALLTSSEKKKFAASVRGNILHVLGHLIHSFQSSILETFQKRAQLMGHIKEIIRLQVESKSGPFEAAVLIGSLRAADFLLQSYGSSFLGTPDLRQLYGHIEQIVNPDISIGHNSKTSSTVKVNRREFQRVALELVGHNAALFQDDLYLRHKQWFKDLITWSRSANSEDSATGKLCILCFLEIIRNKLSTCETTNVEALSFRDNVIQYFYKEFMDIMDRPNTVKMDLTVAIIGIGVLCVVPLAKGLKEKLTEKVFSQLENVLLQLKSWSSGTGSYSTLPLVPIYMGCISELFSSFLLEGEDSLQKFKVRLILTEQLCLSYLSLYPRFSKKYKEQSEVAFKKLLNNIYRSHNGFFRGFLDSLFNDGLTHVIAAPTTLEVDSNQFIKHANSDEPAQETERKEPRLAIPAQRYFSCWIALLAPTDQQEGLTSVIVDVCLQWILSTWHKLDLSISHIDDGKVNSIDGAEDTDVSDPVYSMKANVPRDFQLFFNIVDFFEAFVLKVDPAYFFKWIPTIITEVTTFIAACPLISGFYKVMATTFSVIKRGTYYSSLPNQTVEACVSFLSTLGIKVKEFRDNLLLSVLDVWLAAPDEFVVSVMQKLGDVLRCAFTIGLSYLPIAFSGLEAVERWFDIPTIPMDVKEDLYCQIFPIWTQYFVASGISNSGSSDNSWRQESAVTIEQVHGRLLRIIGSFGHFFKIDDTDCKDDEMVMRVEEKFLKYAIPFHDTKPDLFLDDLLPRIFEICNNTSERQARSSACECLHTFVLYFLGHSTNTSRSGRYEELFKGIFKQVMKLGCDGDPIVWQLFNPLTLQLVHFYTSKSENYDSVMLQVIVDGLTQSQSVQLRDFASVCIYEYFSWSWKSKDLSHGGKMEDVLKMIIALSSHAAPNYRQASVLAFNSIYREFREDDTLVNRFTFAIFHSFLLSLCLLSEYGSDSILVQSTKQAVRHLERVILKKEFFNTAMSDRKVSPELSGCCLQDMVDWIFKKAGQCKTIWGREECCRLVTSLAPAIRGAPSVGGYLKSLESRIGTLGMLGIVEALCPTKAECQEFVQNIEPALDMYVFLDVSGFDVETILSLTESSCVTLLTHALQYGLKFEELSENFVIKTGKLMGIPSIQNLFQTEIKHAYLVSTIKQAATSNQLGDFGELQLTWNSIWNPTFKTTELCILIDELVIGLLNTTNPTIKDAPNLLRVLNLLTATSSLVEKLLPLDNLKEITRRVWNFIDTKIFVLKSNRIESNALPNHIQILLQHMMSLIFQFDKTFDGHKATLFSAQEVIFMSEKLDEKRSKGEVFQDVLLPSLFECPEIYDLPELLRTVKLEKIESFITKLIQALKQRKSLRQRYGKLLVDSIIRVWQQIQLNFSSDIMSRLLSGVISLDSETVQNSVELCNWWTELLINPYKTVRDKSSFVEFIYFFGASKSNDIQNILIETAEKFSRYDWSEDWKSDESFVINIFSGTLSLTQNFSKSLAILKSTVIFFERIVVLVENFHMERQEECSPACQHFMCFTKIHKLFQNIAKLNNSSSFSLSLLQLVYDVLQQRDPVASISIFKYCLLPCLTIIPEPLVRNFYVMHISNIINTAMTSPTSFGGWIAKATAFLLLEVLALRCQADFLKGTELNTSFIKKISQPPEKVNGNEVTKAILQCWVKIKSDASIPEETNNRIRKTHYMCNAYAYNAALAILKAANYEGKFCTGFLFVEKGKIWEKIIDCSIDIWFPVLIRKSTTNLVSEPIQANPAATGGHVGQQTSTNRFRRSRLDGSSLAIEATQFDFTMMNVTETEVGETNLNSQNELQMVTKSGWDDYGVNAHDCMGPLVELIQNLQRKGELPDDLVKSIQHRLSSSATTMNVKTFLIALVLNCQTAFHNYAAGFIESILITLIQGNFHNPITETSKSLNCFEKDVVLMVLGWKDISKPAMNTAEGVFTYMLGKVKHDTKQLMHQNLEFLTEVTKAWLVPTLTSNCFAAINNCFNEESPVVGFHIVNSVLHAGQLPCSEDSLVQFLSTLCKSLSSRFKGTYVAAAETIGFMLTKYSELGIQEFSKIVGRVRKYISAERGRMKQFISILNTFSTSFPSIVVAYEKDIMSLIKTLPLKDVLGLLLISIKQRLLDFRSSDDSEKVDCLKSFFIDLDGRSIFRLPCSEESEFSLGIELLDVLLQVDFTSDMGKLNQLTVWIKGAEDSLNGALRLAYVSSIFKIYELAMRCQGKSNLTRQLQKTLVKMHADDNAAVKDAIYNFWSEHLRNWTKSSSLLLELLEMLDDSGQFISFIVNLLLKRCSMSPDFEKLLFNQPLSDLPYEVHNINTAWNFQNSTLQPLFIDSFSHYLPKSPSNNREGFGEQGIGTQGGGFRNMNMLRATLRVRKFSQTQECATGIVQEKSNDTHDTNTIPVMPHFSQLLGTDVKTDLCSNPLSSLRTRFYANPDNTSGTGTKTFFRMPKVPRKKIQAMSKQSGDVKLVRSYRIGELPDILIKHSELLASMSSLAKVDTEFGKALLSTLIYGIAYEETTTSRQSLFAEDLRNTFQNILDTSVNSNCNAVAIVLKVSAQLNISLPATLLTKSAIRSSLVPAGILKLEQQLEQSNESLQPNPSKRLRFDTLSVEDNTDTWLSLVKLYKEIEELDSVRNIFGRLASCASSTPQECEEYDKARKSLYSHSIGNYCDAVDNYLDLLGEEVTRENPNALKLELWRDGVERALLNLSDWERSYEESTKIIQSNKHIFARLDSSLWLNFNEQRFTSGIHTLLRMSREEEKYDVRLAELKSVVAENFELFMERLPVDFVLNRFLENIVIDEKDLVRKMSRLGMKFETYKDLTRGDKEDFVGELRRMTTLMEVLDLRRLPNIGGDAQQFERLTVVSLKKIITRWQQLTCSMNTSLRIADTGIAERNFYLETILQQLPKEVEQDTYDLIKDVQNLRFENALWVARVAAYHRNNYIGNVYLNIANNLKLETHGYTTAWIRHFCNLISACDLGTYKEKDWARQWRSCWKKIVTTNSEETVEMQCDLLNNLVGNSCNRTLEVDTMKILGSMLKSGTQLSTNKDLIPFLKNWVKSISSTSFNVGQGNLSSLPVDASLKLCRLLRQLKNNFPEKFANDKNINRNLLLCLLHALKYGHLDASKDFPICFSILESFPELGDLFLIKISDVPTWVFLPWVDQIVTFYVHKPILKPFLRPIIESLRQDYPGSFQLEHAHLDANPCLGRSSLLQSFEKALHSLVLPHIAFQDEIKAIMELRILDFSEFIVNFKKKLEIIRSQPIYYGELHQQFVGQIYPKLTGVWNEVQKSQLQGQHIDLISQLKPACFSAVDYVKKKELMFGNFTNKFYKLQDLSPWLANYHFSSFNEYLIVPGQSYGFEKPSGMESEIHIVSFEPTVMVYASKAQPLRLTLLANDGRKYHFIAKFGDDLRQDKRIQQLFRFANSALKTSRECRQRNLRLVTYSVIPVTEKFGLIQMVPGSRSLKEFIFNSPSLEQMLTFARVNYNNWICANSGNTAGHFVKYGLVSMRNRQDVEAGFQTIVQLIPPLLFKENIRASVGSAEKYFRLRERLVRSLGTMSLVNWVFGIGDRHLDNNMISVQSGEFLGIDFGYAFGFGLLLEVPELLPFRLTPQLQNLLGPYGPNGLFKETMCLVMSSLAQASEFILSAAEIFVSEPSVDWTRQKLSDTQSDSSKRRVEVLNEKLHGANPILVMAEILKVQRPAMSNYTSYWIKALKENRGDVGIRSKLSTEESVELLISLAIDPNLLGRTWVGWHPMI